MTGGQALEEEWVRANPAPTGLAGIVALLGGTRAVAEMLTNLKTGKNYVMRTVQRWVKAEKGTGGETRRINAKDRNLLDGLARLEVDRRAVERIRKSGLGNDTSITGTFRVSKRSWTGKVYDTTGEGWEPSNDNYDIGAFCDEIEEYSWESAFDYLAAWLFDAYGLADDITFDDVEAVHLDMPR